MSVKRKGIDSFTYVVMQIAMVFMQLLPRCPKLASIARDKWEDMFVYWAGEFQVSHLDSTHVISPVDHCILEYFAIQKIFAYAGIKETPTGEELAAWLGEWWDLKEEKPWYFSFGSSTQFPYPDRYLIVYAIREMDAVKKFRIHYPDITEGTVNCAFWYSQEEWDRLSVKGRYNNQEPAEIIR